MTRAEVLSLPCPSPRCRRPAGTPCKSTPGDPRVRIGIHVYVKGQGKQKNPENHGQRSISAHPERVRAVEAR